MSAVNDISEQIAKVDVGDIVETSQVVVQDVTTDTQISIVEVVLTRPTLRTEFAAT
jgi:hypothetical protein